jgi:thiaminase/transcriptional activator TenA
VTDGNGSDDGVDRSASVADGSEHATFAESGHDRFTAWLRARAEPDWTAAVDHRFTRELGDGTLDDAVFRRYLVQDYAFVDTLVGLVGHAVGDAPTMAEKSHLSDFLAVLTDDEDDYFRRSFDALDVSESTRTDPQRTATTAAFEDLLTRAAHQGGYAESLAVLVPAEWVYLSWASRAADRDRDRFYLDEWVDLHANPGFEATVGWLREQLDEVGPTLSPRRQARVDRLFRRTAALEVAFFESAYQ